MNEVTRTCWPVTLAYLESSRLIRDPVSKNKMDGTQRRTISTISGSMGTYIQVHQLAQKHKYDKQTNKQTSSTLIPQQTEKCRFNLGYVRSMIK